MSGSGNSPDWGATEPVSQPTTVADNIALQEAELRRWMARRVVWTFVAANAVTLFALGGLVWLDQCNLQSKLITPSDRIITNQVFMALLGATTVQVGTIAALIARYLFPSRSPAAAHERSTPGTRTAGNDRAGAGRHD